MPEACTMTAAGSVLPDRHVNLAGSPPSCMPLSPDALSRIQDPLPDVHGEANNLMQWTFGGCSPATWRS